MAHNVFISWSGPRSKAIADELYKFLPDLIHRADPWLSSSDLEKGTLWRTDIAEKLRDLKVGIICLTPENVDAKWILFEAGALSKTLNESFVCPYLIDLDVTQVSSPLADFNMTRAIREDTLKLVRTLNKAVGGEVANDRIDRTFEKFWPDLEKKISAVVEQKVQEKKARPPRTQEEILEDIYRRLLSLERRTDPVFRRPSKMDQEIRHQLMYLEHKLSSLLNEITKEDTRGARRRELIRELESVAGHYEVALNNGDFSSLDNPMLRHAFKILTDGKQEPST